MGQISADTLQRLYTLFIIESFEKGVFGSTRLQKVTYFSEKEAALKPFEFINHDHGEYSHDLQSTTEQLISMGYVKAFPLDTGEHGNAYIPSEPGLFETHKEILGRISPELVDILLACVDEYGYLPQDILLKRAKEDELYKASSFGDVIIASNVEEHVTTDLNDDECEDLELALNPRFIVNMTRLINSIDCGEIPLEQWKQIA